MIEISKVMYQSVAEKYSKSINYSKLDGKERFKLIKRHHAKSDVFDYLHNILDNVYISKFGKPAKKVMELMCKGNLEGWCWETTQTCISFFEDGDYIARGYLKFDKFDLYDHSWICFKFNEKEYVFDPCLDVLCEKEEYYKIFEVLQKGSVTAKSFKDFLIGSILRDKQNNYHCYNGNDCFYVNGFEIKRPANRTKNNSNETIITPTYKWNAPNYGGIVGYSASLSDNSFKEISANYYRQQ